MILSRLHHVTRTLGHLLPRRGLATAKPRAKTTPYWSETYKDDTIQESLSFMAVQSTSQKTDSLRFPKTLELGKAVNIKFLKNRFLLKDTKQGLTQGYFRPESVQQLEWTYERRMTEPLWIDIYTRTRVPGRQFVRPIVKSTCKRRIKTAILKEMALGGVHPHGWDLAAYERFWKTREDEGGVSSPLPGDDTWPPLIPRRFQGTLTVMVHDPWVMAAADAGAVRKLAAAVVALMRAAQETPPKPLLPPPRDQRPWMNRPRRRQ